MSARGKASNAHGDEEASFHFQFPGNADREFFVIYAI